MTPRAPTPKCSHCGRTIPKYRRPYSDHCTLNCAKANYAADAYSREKEKAIQEDSAGPAVNGIGR